MTSTPSPQPRRLRPFPPLATLVALAGVVGCASEPVHEFEPVPVGRDDARLRRPRTDEQHVRALYADILGRAPTTYDVTVRGPDGAVADVVRVDEEAFLVPLGNQVGDPGPVRALIATGLTASAEADLPTRAAVDDPGAFVDDWFARLLGRAPTTWERQAFVEAWASDPAVTPAVIVRAIVASREYQSR